MMKLKNKNRDLNSLKKRENQKKIQQIMGIRRENKILKNPEKHLFGYEQKKLLIQVFSSLFFHFNLKKREKEKSPLFVNMGGIEWCWLVV